MGSSTAGWDVIYGGGAYMASKEGIAGITRNLALEAAPYGVRVNAVCPGIIETQLSFSQGGKEDAARREWFKRFSRRIPLRRVGLPEDVAAAVAFLASEDAHHITGAQLLIDGGQTLQSWSNAPDTDAYPFFKLELDN
jgi:NAD(P)-dependent dehydrogenase (short-subunit alcohol dehydrogenase family)